MAYYIRPAHYEDAKALGYIHSQSWKVTYKGIVPDNILNNITAEKRAEYFYKALSENLEEDALIFKDGIPTGFICFGKCRDEDKDRSYGEVWGIYLLPEFWNQKMGTELMEWGINELKKRGYEKITLWVLEENSNAQRFYEKIGFYHDGTVKELIIGKPLNEIRYVKIIE